MNRGPDGAYSVPDQDVSVHRLHGDPGVGEARRRFGGVDLPAVLAGLLAAIGSLVLLGGIAGAIGRVGYEYGFEDAEGESLTVGGFVAGVVVLLLSFLIGGWVAGRVARYDGGRNGLLTAVLFVALAAGLAALGSWAGNEYDVFEDVELPQWFRDGEYTGQAIASAVAAALVALLAGWLGGKIGERYHRRADEAIASTRDGGVGIGGGLGGEVRGHGLADARPGGDADRRVVR